MPYTNLILKVINSPWTVPTTDVTVLTKFPYSKFNYPLYEALDKNFIYLRGEVIYDTEKVDDTVTLKKINGNDLSFDVSSSGNGNGNGGDATEPITVEGNLELQGTSPATTSQAIYGINVITGSSTSNLATRLPEPTTGRHTVFVNNSLLPIKVFPSVSGGKINGVVDGVAMIPNDGTPYTFYCIQNPLPGAWTWSAPAIGNLSHGEISINHTNGVQSSGFNTGQQGTSNDAFVGLGMSNGSVILNGTWNTNNFPAWAEKLKVYTNIKWDDIVNGGINAGFTQGYQSGPNGTTHGTKAIAQFIGTQAYHDIEIQEVLNGTGGNNVGDVGTLYMEIPFVNAYPLSRIVGNQCITTPVPGTNDVCQSTGYYTFEMFVNANAETKEYKFQWFIEYS